MDSAGAVMSNDYQLTGIVLIVQDRYPIRLNLIQPFTFSFENLFLCILRMIDNLMGNCIKLINY